jgi:hypothetical protein
MNHHRISKIDCEKELLTLHAEHGRLTIPLIEEKCNFTRRSIRTHFGTLEEFKRLHNLEDTTKIVTSTKGSKRKVHSKEDCLAEGLRLEEIFGFFSKGLLEEHGKINHKVYNRLYGSFGGFFEEHPEISKYNNKQLNFSDEDIKNELLKINGFICSENINIFTNISHVTIRKRYGSIEKCCELFGLEYNPKIHYKTEKLWIEYLENLFNLKAEKQKTFPNLKHKKMLRCDAYFSSLNLIVEYNGVQHYKFSEHLHKDIKNFELCKKRDKIKEDFCEQNNIKLLVIRYDDSEEQVLNKVKELGLST